MAAPRRAGSIFDESQKVVLPWRPTLEMCALNVKHRIGRSMLTFASIAVVVAFFTSSLMFQHVVLLLQQESATAEGQRQVEVQMALETAGKSALDEAAAREERDKRMWLMSLAALMCLVGITNTILMSVTERIREIGTLKCLGAIDSFVVRLFFVESIFVGLLASLAGAVLGVLLALLQSGMVLGWGLPTMGMLGEAAGRAAGLSVVLGTGLTVLAGVYPSYVAARMRPVDAMRTEI